MLTILAAGIVVPALPYLLPGPSWWGLDPMKSLEYIEEKMLPEFPLGVVRDR